jgi:hypothetical protein
MLGFVGLTLDLCHGNSNSLIFLEPWWPDGALPVHYGHLAHVLHIRNDRRSRFGRESLELDECAFCRPLPREIWGIHIRNAQIICRPTGVQGAAVENRVTLSAFRLTPQLFPEVSNIRPISPLWFSHLAGWSPR